MSITLRPVKKPELMRALPTVLKDETMLARKQKVIEGMEKRGLDVLIIYADVEHSGNFEYLTGFIPRFEEALLVLHRTGRACMILGNENLDKCRRSRIDAEPLLFSGFSLPNQPDDSADALDGLLRKAGLAPDESVGVVGWKLMEKKGQKGVCEFDIPYYIMMAVKSVMNGQGSLVNAAGLFLDPDCGVRITADADEIAHYEYGASLASNCVQDAMDALAVGRSEIETANAMCTDGQRNSVVTVCAFGERFVKGNLYPSGKTLSLGDPVSITVGMKGGLSNRSGYAVYEEGQIPVPAYIESLAMPYFNVQKIWLETLRIGLTGGQLYDAVESALPRNEFCWYLNPGHFTADEEWTSSPVYAGSGIRFKSGNMIQLDIIPKKPGFGGAGAEDGLVLADETLRRRLREEYPKLWQRMQIRRDYIREELGVQIGEELLPLSNTLAYHTPLFLNREMAFTAAN